MAFAGVGAWLLVDPLSASEPKDRASAIRTVFTIGFGFGGLATLGLFTRRQWHQERVADEVRYDAEQRRITEQYMQAVEQLGHEKAPVRLGGLYALDRLGRNHPEQRQVIAEVWCAYLRRRYMPPPEIIGEASREEGEEVAERDEDQLKADAEAADEYEVRMTAQRLLAGHLKDPRPEEERDDTRPDESEEYWHLEHLDLTGATLIDANFTDCRLPTLNASRVHFCRDASFYGAYFEGDAWFGGARFESGAWFGGVRFKDVAGFGEARFRGDAEFGEAWFGDNAWFDEAWFERDADFGEAWFRSVAWFDGARFVGVAGFNGARFRDVGGFGGVRFGDRARFDHVGGISAEGVLGSVPQFVMTGVVVERIFENNAHVWPPGWETVPDGNHWQLVQVEE